MVTFRKVHELLLLSLHADDGDISEDEFLQLCDANNLKDPNFPYGNYKHFDLEDLNEIEFGRISFSKKGHTSSCRGSEVAQLLYM